MSPVSYTHLDVYKRQAAHAALMAALQALIPWRKGPFELFGIAVDTEWRSDWKWERVAPHLTPLQDRVVLDAVSYTHLDVYKRQILTTSRCR